MAIRHFSRRRKIFSLELTLRKGKKRRKEGREKGGREERGNGKKGGMDKEKGEGRGSERRRGREG